MEQKRERVLNKREIMKDKENVERERQMKKNKGTCSDKRLEPEKKVETDITERKRRSNERERKRTITRTKKERGRQEVREKR